MISGISLVQQRFAAGHSHHGGAAFIHRVEAFLHREALVEDGRRVVDLAAAATRQVTAEQWLQHQHQRVTLASREMLLEDIRADTQHLLNRNRQSTFSRKSPDHLRPSMKAWLGCPETT